MDDCSDHKKDIAGITDMKLIAEMIVNLHHESVAKLFEELPIAFNNASTVDYDQKNNALGYNQASIAHFLWKAEPHAKRLWEISKQFMNKQS